MTKEEDFYDPCATCSVDHATDALCDYCLNCEKIANSARNIKNLQKYAMSLKAELEKPKKRID